MRKMIEIELDDFTTADLVDELQHRKLIEREIKKLKLTLLKNQPLIESMKLEIFLDNINKFDFVTIHKFFNE